MKSTGSDVRAAGRRSALIALAVLVPAPLLGTWFGMYWEATRGTALGQAVYAISKIWILAVPAVWLLWIEKGRPGWSPPRHGGLGAGVATGVLLSAGIVVAWLVVGRHWIDAGTIRETAVESGIGEPAQYALFALYICTINAMLEEYVWRWFVYRKCEQASGRPGLPAVALSALFFTMHHVLALRAQLDWVPALVASAGVFAGGCVWSALYLKYRSIWPGFFSHVIVDIAIFAIGAWILFGAVSG